MKKDIFIFTNGTLRRKDNTVCYESENERKFIPVEELNSLYIFGEVDVNKRLLEFLGQKGICLHFFNYYDYYVGTYYPREIYNSGLVILKQAEHYLDYGKRLLLAKKFVEGAFSNIIIILRYYNSRGVTLNDEIEGIIMRTAEGNNASSIETLMALEGNTRELYYSCFNKIIQKDDFRFIRRTRNPPVDKINALISFGNSLLYATILAEIYQTQLDPRIGYLHSTNRRKFSLNLDISEIFKPIIVDRTIFTLLNKGILNEHDFNKEFNGIVLNDSGKRKFVQEYNSKLETVINHPKLGASVSYKRIIRLELYKLQKHLIENEEYIPRKV